MAARTHVIPPELAGKPLDAVLRALENVSWGKARGFIETGKVKVDGQVVMSTTRHVRAGVEVVVDERAPRPRKTALERERIVHLDAHVVVVDKPSGISTIPYDDEERETGTLDERVRSHLSTLERASRGPEERGQRPTLGVVHRIDKDTSGLVVFTRTWAAKQSLSQQFRAHTVHRVYLAIVHGDITGPRTYTSHLVVDRGDGLRGSIERMKGRRPKIEAGQIAITHVEPRERLAGGRATLVACRLETGRTHQIRIHLSEAGHILLGERVYIRDYDRNAPPRLPAPRLMLHAAELGFVHPKTEREARYTSPLPRDFEETLARLRVAD